MVEARFQQKKRIVLTLQQICQKSVACGVVPFKDRTLQIKTNLQSCECHTFRQVASFIYRLCLKQISYIILQINEKQASRGSDEYQYIHT